MKLKASKAFRVGGTTFARGADVTVSEAKAKELVARGFAVEVKPAAPKPEPKKAEKSDK